MTQSGKTQYFVVALIFTCLVLNLVYTLYQFDEHYKVILEWQSNIDNYYAHTCISIIEKCIFLKNSSIKSVEHFCLYLDSSILTLESPFCTEMNGDLLTTI